MNPSIKETTLEVSLYKDRTKIGQAYLYNKDSSQLGPFPVLGLADSTMANVKMNPSRNPLLPFGNTPTGVYLGTVIPPAGNSHSFGPGQRIMLTPQSGDCLMCEEIRTGLLAHGGDLNDKYSWWDGLRPTYGCLRFKNDDLEKITSAVGGEHIKVDVKEVG